MALKLTQRIEKETGFLPVEKIGFIYNLSTTLLILILYDRMAHPDPMLLGRFLILIGTWALFYLYDKRPNRLTLFLRIAFQLALLAYWYPDTYEFNRLFPNLDHLFARAEWAIFGYQPAITFSQSMPSYWVSEAFNLGYFSYYPMILTVILFYFFKQPRMTEKVTFIIISAFYFYYVIYIFLPVAGPQFYFPVVGDTQVASGIFPALHDYFNLHAQLQSCPSDHNGLFKTLVELSQAAGERPTAAFPSSHVGISTVVMILAYRYSRTHRLFFWLLPLYLLLCGATVYIQAHYVIDVIAGLITAFIFYAIARKSYDYYVEGK